MKRLLFISLLLCIGLPPLRSGSLSVSEDGRFLIQEDGSPFFYLGDTAWELFHRLTREEAEQYLSDRARKGFTVIQAVALAELDGLNTPNPYGHLPLLENDPGRPHVREGGENDYWDHVDFIIDKANALGLHVGLLPTWGDKWNKKWGVGPVVFNPENARIYGEWIGKRYNGKKIIWILGGDRPIESEGHKSIIRSMARGIRAGDGGNGLMTFHPSGGHSSSEWFHEDEWLDFNMRQNGHNTEFTSAYAGTWEDYNRKPIKPVIDGEPIYEDHPVSFKPKEFGHSITSDIRRPIYWDLFSGAFGHTYGHHSIWQMWAPGRHGINYPLMPWHEAIHQPGSAQMGHAKALILSRPPLNRIPDDSVIVPDPVQSAVPGAGRYTLKATRDQAGSYAMIYTPSGRGFEVDLSKLNASAVDAWWFNPRDGSATYLGEYKNFGHQKFTPPTPGEMLDWVLVLDDANAGYTRPGSTQPREAVGIR